MGADSDIRAQFLEDVKDHDMEVRHDDGLYRHLVFTRNGSNCYRFDLVTWPGYLAYVGDMGAYTFARLADMFEFFRDTDGRINPGYWAEKLQASCDKGPKAYSVKRAREIIAEWLDEYCEDQYPGIAEAVQDEITDRLDDSDESDFYRLCDEFTYFHPDTGKEHAIFSDLWDGPKPTIWTHHYLWACQAIVWGIARYDAYCDLASVRDPNAGVIRVQFSNPGAPA